MCKKVTLLFALLISTTFVSAQIDVQQILDQYANCESGEFGSCEEVYQNALKSIATLESDTAQARNLIDLGEIRKDLGIWDDEVIVLNDMADSLFDKAGDLCGKTEARRVRAAYYLYNEDGDKALKIGKEALELAKECGDKYLLARVYGTLGVGQQNAGEYAAALKSHGEEARLFREINDREGVAISTQEMAYIYSSMGDKQKSIGMMLECASIYKEIGEDMRYGSCIVDLCAIYLELDQPDSVLVRLPEIKEIFKGRYQVGEAAVFYNMGEAYKQKKDYERALANYDRTSELMKELNWPRFLMEIEISRSECYTALGDYEMAYQKILDAEEISNQTSNAEGTMNILQYKMYAAHDVGKHDESYEAALDYIDLKDSLRSIARDQEVAAMQEELEAEKREHEIDILEREAELDEQKRTGLIIIVVLVIIAAILVVNREIQRRKKAKQLHETEIELREANEARLKEELAFKKRELASKALQIAQKNEVLESLRQEVQNISLNSQADKSVKEVLNTL
ncbi:MAG: hypothetical protein AAGC47_16080, partial [Bacteroidota bacterium]